MAMEESKARKAAPSSTVLPILPSLVLTSALLMCGAAYAAEEPLGGQPPVDATPSGKDFDYQIKYQRAFEAILWNMPAIAIYSFRRAAFEHLGYKDNDVIAYSQTATPRLEAITANSSTPYIAAYTDLRKGPVALEVPAAGGAGSLYGQVVKDGSPIGFQPRVSVHFPRSVFMDPPRPSTTKASKCLTLSESSPKPLRFFAN